MACPAIDDDHLCCLERVEVNGKYGPACKEMRAGGGAHTPILLQPLHIVVLDNGRSALRNDPIAREALVCIRCGACLNACPVYRRIGGHAYGTVYAGPIGSVISPYLQPAAAAPDLPFASSLCGACVDVCPVRIDLPGLLVHLRGRAMRGEFGGETIPTRRTQKAAMRLWSFAMQTPWRYRMASRLVRLAARPFVRDGHIQRLPGIVKTTTHVVVEKAAARGSMGSNPRRRA